MSTATDERVEVIVDVDLDAEVVCEDCTAAAEWACTCPNCKHAAQVCSYHRATVDTRNAWGGVTCRPCGAFYPDRIPWRPL